MVWWDSGWRVRHIAPQPCSNQEVPSRAVGIGPGRRSSFRDGSQAPLGSGLLSQGIAAAYALRQQALYRTGRNAAAMTGNPHTSSSQQISAVLEGWKRSGQGTGIWQGGPLPSRSQPQQSTDTDQGGSQARLQGQPSWLCALNVPTGNTVSSRTQSSHDDNPGAPAAILSYKYAFMFSYASMNSSTDRSPATDMTMQFPGTPLGWTGKATAPPLLHMPRPEKGLLGPGQVLWTPGFEPVPRAYPPHSTWCSDALLNHNMQMCGTPGIQPAKHMLVAARLACVMAGTGRGACSSTQSIPQDWTYTQSGSGFHHQRTMLRQVTYSGVAHAATSSPTPFAAATVMFGSNAATVPGYIWQQMQFLAASKGRRQQLLQRVWFGVFQAEAAKGLWQEATGQLVFKWHFQGVLGGPDKCLAHDHRGFTQRGRSPECTVDQTAAQQAEDNGQQLQLVAGLQQQLADVQEQLAQEQASKQQQLATLQQQLAAKDEVVAAAEGKARRLQASLDQFREMFDSNSKELQQLRPALRQLKAQVTDLTEELAHRDKVEAAQPAAAQLQAVLQAHRRHMLRSSSGSSSGGASSSSVCASVSTLHSNDSSPNSIQPSSNDGGGSSSTSSITRGVSDSGSSSVDDHKAPTVATKGSQSSPKRSSSGACSHTSSTTLSSGSVSAASRCSSVTSVQEPGPAAAHASPAPLDMLAPVELGGTGYYVSMAWQQVCGQCSPGATTNTGEVILTPAHLPRMKAMCTTMQHLQLVGKGAEGWVYGLPQCELLFPVTAPGNAGQPGGVYRLPAALKVVELENDEHRELFIQEALRAAPVAAACPMALRTLAAWVQQGQSPETGEATCIGVLLMPRLQCTLLQAASSPPAAQQPLPQQQAQAAACAHRARHAITGCRLGLTLLDQGFHHRDWKGDNMMYDRHGRPWVVDNGHAFMWTPNMPQQALETQSTTMTTVYSCPEQLAKGPSSTILANDAWGVAAAAVELLLGKEVYDQLLIKARVPWKSFPISCLMPPGDVRRQQGQLVRIQAAMWAWLEAAGATQDSRLLSWVSILLGMLHAVPERRLQPDVALAQLQQLFPAS